MSVYYQDDHVTLHLGDCREILPSLGHVDAVVTDPPYGLGKLLNSPGVGAGQRAWRKFYSDGAPEWDAEAPVDVVLSLPALAEHAVIWGGNYFPLPPARGWLVWDKIVRQFSSGHCELAWTTLDQPIRAFNYAHAQLASEGKLHPTQKPLSLMQWVLGFLPRAGLILDPFAGSGTTLVAARIMSRQSIGIEREERYCEVIAKRLAQDVLDFGGAA